MRQFALLLTLLTLAACTTDSPLSAHVTGAQIALVHADLKTQSAARLRSTPPSDPVGCAERRLGAEHVGAELVVYLNFVCGLYSDGPCQAMSSGESSSAVAHLRGDKVERWQFPGDGSQNGKDIQAWFPRSLRSRAAFAGNAAVHALERAAQRDAGCRT